ncbi:MAG TPA: LysM peptidoglycan-binding domain-containing protein [Verrucomicrobiae bacterium]|jgi:LysM repeat protein|nr:LysM peptidoglycan-binding domain-containing protein [Verrucomicrobiae bacterium]
MSAQNPFQIPTCFKLDIEQRRRERFKKTVVTAVIVSVAVVIGLLIEGCVSEKSQANEDPNQATATIQTPAQPATAASQPSQQTDSRISLPVQPCPVATVPKQTATPADPPHITGAAVYLVKSGDTLGRIAKAHHTSVKAIKEANKLATDNISVGEKLNIPTA